MTASPQSGRIKNSFTISGLAALLILCGVPDLIAEEMTLRSDLAAHAAALVQDLRTNGSPQTVLLADELLSEWEGVRGKQSGQFNERMLRDIAELELIRNRPHSAAKTLHDIARCTGRPSPATLRLMAIVSHAIADYETALKAARSYERQRGSAQLQSVEYLSAVAESALRLKVYRKALDYYHQLLEVTEEKVYIDAAKHGIRKCEAGLLNIEHGDSHGQPGRT